MNPKKRQDLIAEQVHDELVLLDPIDLKVHHLNASAAAIFELCDGAHTVEDLARPLLDTLASNDARQYVQATLDLLAEAQLLEPESASPTVGRRAFLKSLSGLVALPVVASVLIPTPSQASTCVPQGECEALFVPIENPCSSSSPNIGTPCCEGNVCNWTLREKNPVGASGMFKTFWAPGCCTPTVACPNDWVGKDFTATCCEC